MGAAGFEYVRSFEMRDGGGRAEYHLIFGTHDKEGLKQMKASMWKTDPSGGFVFSDATNFGQPTLFQLEPDYAQLERMLEKQFLNRSVAVEDIEDFVVCDTPFRESHYKGILKAREARGALEVVSAGVKRRRGQFPDGTVVKLLRR